MANPYPLDEIRPQPGQPASILLNHPNIANWNPPVANSLFFQVLPGNVGKVYVGVRGMNVALRTGIIGILMPPTSNSLPEIDWDNTSQPNPFDLTSYYVDVDIVGDGVRITFTSW